MPAGQFTPQVDERRPVSPPVSPRGASVGGFRVEGVIGKGSFAEVRRGVCCRTGNPVAIKLGTCADEVAMRREQAVYRTIGGQPGFPRLHWAGMLPGHKAARTVLVVDLLSESLGHVAKRVGGKLRLGSVLHLGRKMLGLVRQLHQSNYVHRDIKPDNFLLGPDGKQLYLIDFGLAAKWRDNDGLHRAYCEGGGFSGTPNFASVHAHHGVAPSRRDDLESLFYTLVWLVRGALPWEGLGGRSWQERARRVALRKCCTTTGRLSEGLPEEFQAFAKYVRELPYSGEPDYGYLEGLLHSALAREGPDAETDALDFDPEPAAVPGTIDCGAEDDMGYATEMPRSCSLVAVPRM
eukprot:TRINITY_DN276_c1_g1_i1.p1 TRINITY_DN276_c1_g1~~TRINITY_DN276_c1_g1_i1.p1  ORF type:complete len:383 (+),score=106.90 TRINITY_DN276_c1_g1_i1:101-1150(+)